MGFTAQGQTLKFGHISGDELIQALPEYDSAVVKLENYRQELVNALELLSVELNNKSDTYNKEEKNYTDMVKQVKQNELIDLNRRIQEFQTTAQENMQNKQIELIQPIYEKVESAIKSAAKENGFVYVFDTTTLRYFDETKSTDIAPLVRAKLGLK